MLPTLQTDDAHHMNLYTLLKGIAPWPAEQAVSITGMTEDSRKVRPGDLFIAYAGPKSDRPRFIEQAIKNGAVAILKEIESDTPSFEVIRNIPTAVIPHLKKQVATIAARFYENPSDKLKFIGITGTNGKTSCALFIAHLLAEHQVRCGIVGTLGAGFPNEITPGTLTTPGAIDLQHTLATLQQRGATQIAMEVSSHSLVQHRVAGIPFETAVFTNLTRDHLDYHGDMYHYGEAKRLLFLTPGLKHAVINADDAFGRDLLGLTQECGRPARNKDTERNKKVGEPPALPAYYAYSIEHQNTTVPTVYADNLKFHSRGFSADIRSPWGEGELHSQLLGRFNLSNLLAALTTLCVSGLPFHSVLAQLTHLSTVPGRMQCLGGGDKPLVVVDYAHTPDALEKALLALREHTEQKLWCVFGCGGDRDAGKRPLMGQIAEAHSDHIVITNDNPRSENPKTITDEILKGIKNSAVIVEHDRKRAIAYALQHAKPGDVILIAGKGHETYQQIGDTRTHFSDAEEVALLLNLNT